MAGRGRTLRVCSGSRSCVHGRSALPGYRHTGSRVVYRHSARSSACVRTADRWFSVGGDPSHEDRLNNIYNCYSFVLMFKSKTCEFFVGYSSVRQNHYIYRWFLTDRQKSFRGQKAKAVFSEAWIKPFTSNNVFSLMH